MAGGLGWECADHYRNLMSKIFITAKKWGFFAGDNPATGVELPEKKAVREKHVLLPEQIPPLLAALEEPVRTMVLVGVLTGLRIGEILALRLERCRFQLQRNSRRAGLLSGSDRHAENQGQPPYSSHAGASPGRAQASEREIRIGRAFSFSYPQWHPVQRHQPAPSSFEAGRTQARDALAQLAHSAPNSRHAACNTREQRSERHKRSWVTRRCPLPSKFTQSRFRKRSGRQSKIFRIW